MRILFANDGFGNGGGVQTYLSAVIGGLRDRGHVIAVLHCSATSDADAARTPGLEGVMTVSIAAEGLDGAMRKVERWQPDVVYLHNMAPLEVERRLLDTRPVAKFMHGYMGTCIGGQKQFGFPVGRPCDRRFGPPCLALYPLRHCGALSPATLVHDYRWSRAQNDLFSRYRAIVVASAHMKREYVDNGADANRVHVNALFAPRGEHPRIADADEPCVAFIGRMTDLKGGHLLIEAVAGASRTMGRDVRLTMIGDGPRRATWEALATRLHVRAAFAGWQEGDARWPWLRGAGVLAIPSVWPEPFALVGLEAAACGVPSIAFDVGGIREWLADGVNGRLVPASPPRAAALADALVRLFAQPDELRRMRQAASRVAGEMSLEAHLDRLESLLAGIPEPRAHPARR